MDGGAFGGELGVVVGGENGVVFALHGHAVAQLNRVAHNRSGMDFGEYLVFCVFCSCAWLTCMVMLLDGFGYGNPIPLALMTAGVVCAAVLAFSCDVLPLTVLVYVAAVVMRPDRFARRD